ncbi:MAG: DUF1385 domain-containing protein [Acidimicrobiales bacterium]
MADRARYVGGQAVVEGVMMRGQDVWAVAVRTPEGGIEVAVHPVPTWGQRWSGVPLARGIATLVESVGLGMKALSWSAARSNREEQQLGKGQMAATVAVALVAFVGLFLVLPALATRAAGHALANGVAFNLVEGGLRLGLFLGYLLAISRVAEVQRVFQYHGAEHKAIAAYENAVPLVPEEAQRFTTEHVRCGTNFLLTVMVLTILVYSVFGRPSWAVLIASRALLIPVVAALAYEVIRLAARNLDRRWVRSLMTPGLALQRLTTREPSLEQLEVAIAALRAALTAEELTEVEARAA